MGHAKLNVIGFRLGHTEHFQAVPYAAAINGIKLLEKTRLHPQAETRRSRASVQRHTRIALPLSRR